MVSGRRRIEYATMARTLIDAVDQGLIPPPDNWGCFEALQRRLESMASPILVASIGNQPIHQSADGKGIT
jgi:hypothetical protein